VDYEHVEINAQYEATSFSSSGVVTTADGRQIQFDVSLEMRRESVEVSRFRFHADEVHEVDPLVINFGGQTARLTDETMAFDLDADGESEDVSFVQSGSGGFLVLDHNGDGQVNDGSELFGPTTGNGFEQLAQYDDDGNGWIDENDGVFSQLNLWTSGSGQEPHLMSLQEANVGAIHLAHAPTPFAMQGTDDRALGTLGSTGIYLTEDGKAGTIQQLDLAVQQTQQAAGQVKGAQDTALEAQTERLAERPADALAQLATSLHQSEGFEGLGKSAWV